MGQLSFLLKVDNSRLELSLCIYQQNQMALTKSKNIRKYR